MSLESCRKHAPVVLLVVSVALNVVLSQRLAALQRPAVTTIEEGARVPALDVKTLSGDDVTISFGGELPTLFYYFSPTCSWCERNWENIRALTAAAPGKFRFVGLSPTDIDVEKVMREHDLDFEVYSSLSPDATRSYHFGATPSTVLVSPEGTVLRAWSGAFGPNSAPEIEQYFGVTLPGLDLPAQP